MTTATDTAIPGATVHEDTVVPACEPWSARIAKGDMLRLVDLEGRQAIDFLCYNADDPAEQTRALQARFESAR